MRPRFVGSGVRGVDFGFDFEAGLGFGFRIDAGFDFGK